MTHPGPPFGNPGAERNPWRDNPQAPTNYPEYPLNYPEYPPAYSPPPPPLASYGYPPPYPGGRPGYGGQMGYPSPYDNYDPYRVPPSDTNGLAIGSLVTSIAGVVLGIPLTFLCYVGLLIPIVGIVLGAVALNQINRTNQQGRGLAIAGIAVGAITVVLLIVLVIVVIALALGPFSAR
ncbi:MAG: DUF4190 domain-containing protein [Pseudonocardiaceae bacterium]